MTHKPVKKLVILCGGTGGHFYPGLTIARKLQEDSSCKAIIFIAGHKDKISHQKNEASKHDIEVYETVANKLSKNPIGFIKFLNSLIFGFFLGRELLKQSKPDAILGMGSFTSIPVSLAAISLKIPIFLHDGNARIGRANQFLSKWAKLTMSAFPAVNLEKIKSEYQCTGMPVRPEIFQKTLERKDAIEAINKIYNANLVPHKKTILVFGGSQGAHTINTSIPLAINKLHDSSIQIIHIFGFKPSSNPYNTNNLYSLNLESSTSMHLLYTIADLVISRSGGSTIAELESFNKNAILIPYPYSTDNHQEDNAMYYFNKGKSVVIKNKDVEVNSMSKIILKELSKQQSNIIADAIPATQKIISLLKVEKADNE